MTNKIVQAKSLYKGKVAPELHFHASATLIVHGDHTSLNASDRKDKEGEIGQFAIVVPSKFLGRLKRIHVEQSFISLKEAMLKKLREHGVMASGE